MAISETQTLPTCSKCGDSIEKNTSAYSSGIPYHTACLVEKIKAEKEASAGVLSTEEILELRNRFAHHPPKNDQTERYEKIREAAYEFAVVVKLNTPKSADQTVAIRQIQLAMMLANSTIACNE